MRNIFVGIIIGCVIGIVLGVTILSPKLTNQPQVSAIVSERDLEKASDPSAVNVPSLFEGDVTTWRTSAAYPATLPSVAQQARSFSRQLATLSGDKLILPTTTPDRAQDRDILFAALASGQIDALMATADIAVEKESALWMFSALPFGPDPSERLAWMVAPRGHKVLKDSFNNHNIEPIVCGYLPARGLWMNTPLINEDQLSTLRLYVAGLAARVWAKLGAQIAPITPDEILAAFDREDIEGAVFDGPSMDAKAGFSEFAKNFYMPAWLNDGQPLLLLLNSRTWNRLSQEHRSILRAACLRQTFTSIATQSERQLGALADLSTQNVRVRRYPSFITTRLKEAWEEVIAEEVRRDKALLSAWEDFKTFLNMRKAWEELKESDPLIDAL